MGEVWKVRDMRLDRTIGIKTSHATKFSERFEREARAVAALNHPHSAYRCMYSKRPCTMADVGR
jgi:serine/threonine protein kinase